MPEQVTGADAPRGATGLAPEALAEWLERMAEACGVKTRYLEETAALQANGGETGPWNGRERERKMALLRVRAAAEQFGSGAAALRGALVPQTQKPKSLGDVLAGK